MDMKLDLFELLREFPEATLTVHAGDLGHFARELLAEARQDFERERAAIAEGKTEEYLTPEMVKTLLRKANFTILRNQDTYLCEVLYITNCGIWGYLGELRPALGSKFTLFTVQEEVENGALTLVDISLGVVLPKDGFVQNGRQHPSSFARFPLRNGRKGLHLSV